MDKRGRGSEFGLRDGGFSASTVAKPSSFVETSADTMVDERRGPSVAEASTVA